MSELENLSSGNGDLVVVGSSAGGIEALSIFVSTLPANFPAPIVLAQHLDPNRPSSLDTILQRRTPLAVEVIHSRSNLQPGTIYVVPSNRHVSIVDGHVEVQSTHPKRPTPSVDLLLSSAAEVYAERLIAVILTGSGSDGAAGAIEVKNLGGTVIIQDPQTARYPSMPLALPPTVIDFKVEIEQIGPLLYDLLNGVNLRQPEEKTEDVLRSVLEQVSRQASIDFRPYKSSTILRRIGRRMTVTQMRSMRDYLEYLKTFPAEVGELVKAFLINVTQFFRDPEAFSYLKKDILLDLITKARERDHTLRFWTAGCATGEEPYSLAMLIAEMLGDEFSAWNIKIFATDLDEAAITFARRGVYSETMLKDMPEGYDTRYFERTDHGYRIAKLLRQMVIFGQQDLSRSAPFPRIDLVLCRNVLIYFTPELQEYVLNQFAYSLSAGGYLFLGKAETVHPLQTYYEMVNKRWKVYRCIGNALPSARRPNSSELHVSRSENNSGRRAAPSSEQHSDQAQLLSLPIQEVGQLRRFNEVLLRFLPMGVVVIDRSYRIVTANSSARRLLGLREIANEQDFLHAIRGIPYTEVRNAIDTVFRERNVVNLPEVELTINSGGNGHFIYFSIAIMQLETEMPDLAILSVTDVTEQVQSQRQLGTAQSEQTQLMHELAAANKRLNDMNKDLLDANEEFQVANEELMLTHEELQASIEEFETTNEELQATNEELQATNEELETTNDELRARTSELQETTILLESERVLPSHDANGKISGVIIYAVDETEQRVKEIVEEREKLRLIFDHSDMAAFALYDAQTAELIIASSRYLDMVASTHDMDRSELNGKKWHDMTINSLTGEADKLWRTALETHQPVHLPEVHSGTSADKQESVWGYSLIPIYSSEREENIRFIVVSAIDITKQVQARQELMQLNRIKDDFLSLASHELRTPLTSIMGHSELLQRNLKRLESSETPRSDFAQEVHLLDMIVHQSRRLNHLIEEMMDITRIRSEQLELKHMENVNLVKLVQRVLEQYSDSNREITLVTQEEEIIGNCDEGRLEQVLNNLISNAIKYSEANKPIEVRVERTKHEVMFAVQDEGRGISEEQQRHIFERFYRVHTNANTGIEGLGLGLYIAHEIVIRHGGRMWLESRTGQGSTFYFSLPLPKAES